MERVKTALQTLHEEQDIADAMAGNPLRQRKLGAKAVLGGGSNSVASREGGKEHRTERRLRDGTDRSISVEHREDGSMSVEHPEDRSMSAGTLSRKQSRTRDVLAVYKHRGAQLVLAQTRKRHPFKHEGVFCRADRGEWASQVIKSEYR